MTPNSRRPVDLPHRSADRARVFRGTPLALTDRVIMQTTGIEGRRIELRGTVHGVGMRPWIYRVARELGVAGRVWNQPGGVTIDAFASGNTLVSFIHALEANAPPAARIEALEAGVIPLPDALAGDFVIVESRRSAERHVSIPPDLATCAACAAEIVDPSNRRYRYPFTNCTNCGPRFTIATDVPYDRPATTMGAFAMCPACRREYDDPLDRRFHAQPNACPVCGPHLTALMPDGSAVAIPDVIAFAAGALVSGHIVALKGLGGFHLACDANSSDAVRRLRLRKRRDEKPFAVMVAGIPQAEQIAVVGPEAKRSLESIERPIVLLPRRAGASVADDVAPHNPLIGVMLPYTPLHHLLLADAGRPLVMTSGNLSEEPIVYRNDEAVARLGAIADLIVVHDREIVTRCDDSVATIVAGAPMVLRRSRGFVPRAIALERPVGVPALACGALLKNTFCLAYGREAWLGPHIGDLENAATFGAYEEAIDRMERFLGFRGEIVAHDLHPDYLSTRYAQARARDAIAVQHHHAHVVSLMAEQRLEGPVIGVAFDGTGYGLDGTAWGGEVFVADTRGFERAATFRPVRLPGADAAIRQPWRIAVALLDDAFGEAAPLDAGPLFARVDVVSVAAVKRMLDAHLVTPAARGVGRYFDGIGALVLGRPAARYEGQIAFELNMALDPHEPGSYDYEVDISGAVPELDFRRVTRGVVRDLLDGVAAPVIAARFHNSVIAATAATVRRVARAYRDSRRPAVALTGGCFQNVRLAEGIREALAGDHDVYLHRHVPPGDGGIALGQAVIASALAGG